MDESSIVSIIIVIAIFFILLIVVWKGRGIFFQKNNDGITFKTDKEEQNTVNKVEIGKELKANGSNINEITGSEGSEPSHVDILNKAKLDNVQIDKIIGIKK